MVADVNAYRIYYILSATYRWRSSVSPGRLLIVRDGIMVTVAAQLPPPTQDIRQSNYRFTDR